MAFGIQPGEITKTQSKQVSHWSKILRFKKFKILDFKKQNHETQVDGTERCRPKSRLAGRQVVHQEGSWGGECFMLIWKQEIGRKPMKGSIRMGGSVRADPLAGGGVWIFSLHQCLSSSHHSCPPLGRSWGFLLGPEGWVWSELCFPAAQTPSPTPFPKPRTLAGGRNLFLSFFKVTIYWAPTLCQALHQIHNINQYFSQLRKTKCFKGPDCHRPILFYKI